MSTTLTNSRDGDRLTTPVGELSLTRQEFADECDVNHIMRGMERSGVINHLNPLSGSFGDFTGVSDYQTALHEVEAAQAEFDALPSRVRNRMANDPANLIAFMEDDANEDEARELGLLPDLDEQTAPPETTPPITTPEVTPDA